MLTYIGSISAKVEFDQILFGPWSPATCYHFIAFALSESNLKKKTRESTRKQTYEWRT